MYGGHKCDPFQGEVCVKHFRVFENDSIIVNVYIAMC